MMQNLSQFYHLKNLTFRVFYATKYTAALLSTWLLNAQVCRFVARPWHLSRGKSDGNLVKQKNLVSGGIVTV